MRSVPTAECSTCHGTGTAPGDGRTKCGFCDGVAPVVPSVDVIERARQLLLAADNGNATGQASIPALAELISSAPALIGELCDHLEAARAALHECTTERDQLAAHLDSSPREPA